MLVPVILSGGSGTRLWPVSREAMPKPFMKLGSPYSLLQRTLIRALPLADAESLAKPLPGWLHPRSPQMTRRLSRWRRSRAKPVCV